MNESPTERLLELTRQLLDSIASGDWNTYQQLCDPGLSCFEPEARGHLVSGMPFHKFYFDLARTPVPRNTTVVSPHVRMLGNDVGIVSYIRLVQFADQQGQSHTARFEETRVWHRQDDGRWRHVHFHRSANT